MKRLLKLFVLLLILGAINFTTIGQSRDWTILSTYSIPGKASGLAWDGTYLYFGIYGSNGSNVHRFDPTTGTNQLQFSNPTIGDSYGMTFDGENLWIIDRGSTGNAYALELSLAGAIISQFTLPQQYMSGIAFDNGDFWASSYYPDPGWIYKVNSSGTVLQQFAPPQNQTWDLGLDGSNLWVVDYNANSIYKIDQQGTIIESHTSETQRPSGVVFDGTYLWYVAGALGSNSTLYKVDPGGAGAPNISISQTEFDFGNVTIGTPGTVSFNVSNIGQVPANINFENFGLEGLTVSPSSAQIAPGATITVQVFWNPQEIGTLDANALLISNDPLQQQTNLHFIGNALKDGPYLTMAEDNHNYYDIRTTASKRWIMDIKNWGDETLSISSVSINNSNFYLGDVSGLAIDLPPLANIEFEVWFQPSISGNFEAILTILNNDPEQPSKIVNLSGSASDGYWPIGATLWMHTISSGFDNSPKAISYVQDVNNDGRADAIICSEDNYVRCINGNASGISEVLWETFVYSGSVYQQNGLTQIDDIDDDGFDDIIVGTAWGDRSVIALSAKTGDVIWKYQTNNYGDGGWVYQVNANFDYNSDGFPDVLASTGNDGTNTGPKRVFCINGKTGVPLWNTPLNGAVYAVIGIEDVNNDGIPDVIAGASNPSETQGRVVGISGQNGSILWNFDASGSSVFALESIDDINGDGKAEIIAGSFNGTYYLMNPVNGAVLHQGSLGNVLILRMITMGDVNGDGYVDIIPAHSGTGAMMINGFNGEIIWGVALPDKSWNVQKIPDLNGDGISDIALGTLYQSNYAMFLNAYDGSEMFSENFGEALDAIGVLPDETGDGSWEMIAGGREGKIVCYAGGLDALTFSPEKPIQSNENQVTTFPNPFDQQMTFDFELTENETVSLSVYTINGTLVWQQKPVIFTEGAYKITWDGKNFDGNTVSNGLYLYEINFNTISQKGRLVKLGN